MENQDWLLLALEAAAVLLLISLFLMRFAVRQKQKIAQQKQQLQQAQQQQKKQAQQIKALMASSSTDQNVEEQSKDYNAFIQLRLAALEDALLSAQDEDVSNEPLPPELQNKPLPDLTVYQQSVLQQLYLNLENRLDLSADAEDAKLQLQMASDELFGLLLSLWWPKYSEELIRTPAQQAVADVAAREVQSEADLGMSMAEAATLLANYTQESQQMLLVIKDLEAHIESLEKRLAHELEPA